MSIVMGNNVSGAQEVLSDILPRFRSKNHGFLGFFWEAPHIQLLESASYLGTQEKCSRACRTLFRTLVAPRAVVISPSNSGVPFDSLLVRSESPWLGIEPDRR